MTPAKATVPNGNKTRRRIPVLLAIAVACSAATMGHGPALVEAAIDAAEHREFADAFTGKLFKKENECSSTWGVSMCMDLIRPGGNDAVVGELCNGMALCGPEASLLWKGAVGSLTRKYDGSCTRKAGGECLVWLPTLEVANSIWIDDGDAPDMSYKSIVRGFLRQIDFDDAAAGQLINDWVKEETHGLIDEIIGGGPIEYDLVAVNSIYLKAAWLRQFKTAYTNKDKFYANPSRNKVAVQNAHFMHQVGLFRHSATALPGFQVIQLPYDNSAMSMLIALPKAAVAGKSPMATDVVKALPSLKEENVALALPKFNFESEYETDQLKAAFDAVGVRRPFNFQDFCGLVEGMCLYIEKMIQKTSIEVDEKGTVAAAVTLVGMRKSRPPPTAVLFLADSPFYFFIYDETEDLVLFEGRVGKPATPANSRAPLKLKNSDPRLWKDKFNVQVRTTRSTMPVEKKAATFKKCRNRMKARKGRCCRKLMPGKRRRCFTDLMKESCSGKIYRNRGKGGSTQKKFEKFLKNACHQYDKRKGVWLST